MYLLRKRSSKYSKQNCIEGRKTKMPEAERTWEKCHLISSKWTNFNRINAQKIFRREFFASTKISPSARTLAWL